MTRLDPLACAFFLMLAFFLAGLAQVVWLRSALSRWFQSPLDGGQTLAGKRIFGANKTWRGFVVMVPAVGVMFLLLRILGDVLLPGGWPDGLWPLSPEVYAGLGCWTGFGFMAGELPNSFCKRQLGIAPGARPARPLAKTLCFTVDRLDSILGAFLALALVVPVPPLSLAFLVLVGPAIHWSFSVCLFFIGLKAYPA
jgi:hypothetical protein